MPWRDEQRAHTVCKDAVSVNMACVCVRVCIEPPAKSVQRVDRGLILVVVVAYSLREVGVDFGQAV